MGFKKATQRPFIAHNMVFSSKKEYLNAKHISKELELLYSSSRDNEEELNSILDKVEELIDRFDKNTKLRVGDEDFNPNFVGIIRFLYEASYIGLEFENEITKKISDSLKKRFVSISDKLLTYCVFIEF